MNNEEKARELIDKYLRKECTEEERALVERFYLDQFRHHSLQEEPPAEGLKASIWKNVSAATQRKKRRPVILHWPRIAVAITVALVVEAGLYFFAGREKQEIVQEDRFAGDVGPGGNKATLALTDGRTIELNESKEGITIHPNEVTYNDGTSIDTSLQRKATQQADFYTLFTPRGGQYQATLPDGTKVWLNAASSLKYPTSFAPLQKRRVILTGEAYFEVAHDQHRPFLVKAAHQEVEVLGTHFNISSYADEELSKTTLLEGAVRVLHRGSRATRVLKPGQQADVRKNAIHVTAVNPDEAIAWKNGKFVFSEESLESILKRVTRWYDVEIEYKDTKARNILFGGSMSRFDNISKVLTKLEVTGDVHFEIVQGKTRPKILVGMKKHGQSP